MWYKMYGTFEYGPQWIKKYGVDERRMGRVDRQVAGYKSVLRAVKTNIM